MTVRSHLIFGDNMDLSTYRKEFPVTETLVYLNHAGVSPTSTRARDAIADWLVSCVNRGILDEEDWVKTSEACRARYARMIGASPEEICFVRNTSHGLALVAEGLSWKPGDRVAVATTLEYPSNVYVWQHLKDRGVEVDTIAAPDGAVTPEAVEATLNSDTRLVAVSSAQYATGAVTDLAAIGGLCNDRGILFCVDGIQTIGALDIDVKQVGAHFLSADSHKWLLGMHGLGALYVSSDVIDRVRPVLVGWKSTTDAWNFDRALFELLSDARKFEEGSLPWALIIGFHAALELLEEIGIPTIGQHINGLIEQLAHGLTELGADVYPPPEMRHHILTFTHPNSDGAELLERLTEQSFVISRRRERIRISPHLYNTADEIDRLIAAVRAYLNQR
jgi:cysteine desulfurase/selenocysteine lyase